MLEGISLCSLPESTLLARLQEVDSYCDAAGRTGGGQCGSPCDNFCHVVTERCTGANQAFESASQCEKNCNNYAEGQALDTSGNSKWCRLNQVASAPVAYAAPEEGQPAANAADLATACAAAKGKSAVCAGDCLGDCTGRECGTTSCGKSCGTCATGLACTPAGKCQPDCLRYCNQVTCNCPSAYENVAVCVEQCQAAATAAGANAAALLQCMTWQAAHAGDNVDAELTAYRCAKAGPDGWAKCGDWCDSYCDMAMENCTGTAKLYNTVEDCQDACDQIPLDTNALAVGFPGEPSDTVQCRLGYLVTAKQTPVLSCPEAKVTDADGGAGAKACSAK